MSVVMQRVLNLACYYGRGVSGFLRAVYTRRTSETDAWTLQRATFTNNNSMESNREPDSKSEAEGSPAYDHAPQLAREQSEKIYKEWGVYWETVQHIKNHAGYLDVQDGEHEKLSTWSSKGNSNGESEMKSANKSASTSTIDPKGGRRWFFALRHAERVDLTYGQWTPHCFDKDGNYLRKDLNLPLTLPERAGGKDAYARDTPLTRVGRLQAWLVGEGLRLAGVRLTHVYASAALRCVETAHELLAGLGDPSVKVRVEPGLFEYKMWHAAKGLVPFMTPLELHKAGYSVDLNYKPYVDLDVTTPETLEECFARNEKVMQSVVKDTEAEGGNVVFVGHAATLDMTVVALSRLGQTARAIYSLSPSLLRVPYCALAAFRDRPWQLVPPPCPPSINSSSGRFDWTTLQNIKI